MASTASLNREQKKAVKSENKRVLVLAGAGSGKTKTLLQKIMYLIQEKKAKPEEILAITFTKNAADEMIDRMLLAHDVDGFYQSILEDTGTTSAQKRYVRLQKLREQKWIGRLTISTFHSLCYKILKSYGAKEFDNKFKLLTDTKSNDHHELSKLSADETQLEVLHKMLIKLCSETPYLLMFKRYIIDYMIDKLHLSSRAFINDYPEGKYYTSLNGDKVRSKSEQYICDWLYRHNINYAYEPIVEISDFEFKPDFYIPDANLYLEHISAKSAKTIDKEKEFFKAGRHIVNTYEGMTHDTNHFNLALTRIIKGRLPASYAYDKALHYEEELKGRHKEVKDFLRQCLRILDMMQVDNIDIDQMQVKIDQEPHERIRLFYMCCLPIIAEYRAYCIDRSYLDFNELVSTAIALIKNDETVKDQLHTRYKYILVDEFQDVNKIQIQLIKNIMKPSAQLFCVGDDWQSIYGFRGSDVSFIVNFSKYFLDGEVIHLNKNYRSSSTIVNASNEVINHNKIKIDKQISSKSKSKKKIEVFAGTDFMDTVEFVVQEIRDLLTKGLKEDDILILYRRNKMFEPYRERLVKEKLKIYGKTIHAAKGLEARCVFLIGMTEGSGGFPDVWMEDRIYQIIRPADHNELLEEERRLFYVAITRAREYLYLITEIGNESSFIDEISDENKILYSVSLQANKTIPLCEKCNRGVEKIYQFCPYCGHKIGLQN